MFGKFSKKKFDKLSSEIKSISKNDLSTFLEGSPKDEIKSIESSLEHISNSDPESSIVENENQNHTNDSKYSENLDSLKDPNVIHNSAEVDKSQRLLFEIEQIPDKTIKPIINFNDNSVSYPLLSKIGQPSNNISFFNDLVADGTLKRAIHEKLIICPTHREIFSSSVKLYCPKCNSVNVEKLNLYEHIKCGFITENSKHDFSDPKNSECPACGKKIVDFNKDIRIPAMWHQCVDCSEKFDNAIIKMFCRQYEHDFDINSGHFVTTYSYQLRDHEAPITSVEEKLRDDLIALLNDLNFSAEFKALVKGKSGNRHKVPIFAKNNSNSETIAIFIDYDSGSISKSDITSILIPILDVGPNHTLLISSKETEEEVEPFAKQYGIKIFENPNPSKIVEKVDDFVTKHYSELVKDSES